MRTHCATQGEAREELRRQAVKPPVGHVPGPCIAVLRSVDYDVRRAKDECEDWL